MHFRCFVKTLIFAWWTFLHTQRFAHSSAIYIFSSIRTLLQKNKIAKELNLLSKMVHFKIVVAHPFMLVSI